MKTSFATLVMILCCAGFVLPAPRLSAAIPAPSSITAVTVYADRAVVTRSATVDLVRGTQEFEFAELPATLADQSLQVAGRGEAKATILDIAARPVVTAALPDGRIRGLEEEMKELKRQTRGLDDRGRIVGKQLEYIERILAASTSQPAFPPGIATAATPRPSLEEWRQLQGFYEESLVKFAAEEQALDRQREGITARQAALEEQLTKLRGPGARNQKSVTVRLDAAYPGKLQLAVTYTVPHASWSPAYDARLHSASRTVELSYFGVVRQNTGEDWDNVALTLSTARPALGGAAPELAAWSVSVWQNPKLAVNLKDGPMAYSVINRAFIEALGITDIKEAASWAAGQRSFFQNAAGSGDSYAVESFDFGRGPKAVLFGGAAANPETQTAWAAINAHLTNATFRIASPTSLPANNTTQKVAISAGNLAATLKYHATPKLRENAFLSATAANDSDYPLLAGPLNAFLDDVFIASGHLRTVMPGEEFELPLGADDGIAIKRRAVNRFQENTGLSNAGRRVTYEYAVTVTNNKKTAERITVREPLPVSKDEKVVVKVILPAEREIGAGERIREISREPNGGLAWQLDLKPGEKREVTLKFSVEHPAEVAVVGLE